MNAHFSDPLPGAEASENWKPAEGQRPVDPPLREYATPASRPPPVVPPVTPQPAYPVDPSRFVAPPYPGRAEYIPTASFPVFPGAYPAWPARPPLRPRDTYTLVVGIVAFIGACLAILGGLGCALLMLLAVFEKSIGLLTLSGGQYFGSMMEYLTLAVAGLVGGGCCFYHSLRSLFFRKPSSSIWLPRFWIFVLGYLATLGLGLWLHTRGVDVASPFGLGLLIILAGIFPALAIMTLGIRRMRLPGGGSWPTTWRRLVLALVSGATLSIALAALLELMFLLLLVGSQGSDFLQFLNNPTSSDSPLFGVLVVLAAVVAPLVEELVKPLAVLILIGRVSSRAEAFTLGLACGIGFNLVETTGYISLGYNDWLNIALGRSGAGLLHGFGSAMVALGWYILTHPRQGPTRRRIWLALSCGGYAVAQHALWNGSVALVLLPGPLGTFFQTWSWNLGPLYVDGYELVNVAEVVAILVFFLFMARRLRARPAPPVHGVGEASIAVTRT